MFASRSSSKFFRRARPRRCLMGNNCHMRRSFAIFRMLSKNVDFDNHLILQPIILTLPLFRADQFPMRIRKALISRNKQP